MRGNGIERETGFRSEALDTPRNEVFGNVEGERSFFERLGGGSNRNAEVPGGNSEMRAMVSGDAGNVGRGRSRKESNHLTSKLLLSVGVLGLAIGAAMSYGALPALVSFLVPIVASYTGITYIGGAYFFGTTLMGWSLIPGAIGLVLRIFGK